MIEMMWNITVIDISTTLRGVLMKVCKDKSVSDTIRKKRARAVLELCAVWEGLKSKGNEGGAQQKSVRNLYASATAAAMEATLEKARREEEERYKKEQGQ